MSHGKILQFETCFSSPRMNNTTLKHDIIQDCKCCRKRREAEKSTCAVDHLQEWMAVASKLEEEPHRHHKRVFIFFIHSSISLQHRHKWVFIFFILSFIGPQHRHEWYLLSLSFLLLVHETDIHFINFMYSVSCFYYTRQLYHM